MKLNFLVFSVVILIYVEKGQCRQISWLPQSLVETFTNKTSQITDYVKDKGRNVKNFYTKNVNRLTTYLGFDKNETVYSKEEDLSRKFKDYFDEAESKETKLFDAIAPKEMDYKCLENDPAVYMSTPQLIAMHGYYSESHTVMTDDGYILTLHRIPFSKHTGKRTTPKTVLLHHGLLGSSADWVIPGPEKGLAYILSDEGYDVWMANVRGNTYSRAHVSRNIDTYAFWNFTWHDVGQHDLPAVIDYIMELKGRDAKINYIGHSMGTTILFSLLSTKVEYNKILRAGFALAPVAYMSQIQSPIRYLAKFSNNLAFLMKLLGANEFLPQNSVLRWLSKHACEINHYEEVICENSLFVLCGHDESQFNRTLLPLILGHVPAGASTKSLIHYAQEIKANGRFQQFDFGKEGNLREYGTESPPEYAVENITLPMALLSAQNDWLAGESDVKKLYSKLSNPIQHYVVPLKQFNHIDFLWAVDADKLVYDKLLELIALGDGVFDNTIGY